MKQEQELVVISKTYDLILWSCNHTSRFPRNHRFVLGERIERVVFRMPEKSGGTTSLRGLDGSSKTSSRARRTQPV